MRIDHGKRFVNGKVYINGIEGFWSFAKERLMKYDGRDPKKFPLHLTELGFRYNHRHHDLYDAVVKCMSEYSFGGFYSVITKRQSAAVPFGPLILWFTHNSFAMPMITR